MRRKKMKYKNIEYLTETEKLCEYCSCTNYGENLDAKRLTALSSGCEGAYCEDVYEENKEEFRDKDIEEKIKELRELVWGMDIPSPTIPEYVELHEKIQKILEFIDTNFEEVL